MEDKITALAWQGYAEVARDMHTMAFKVAPPIEIQEPAAQEPEPALVLNEDEIL